jgi:hypothetical protein
VWSAACAAQHADGIECLCERPSRCTLLLQGDACACDNPWPGPNEHGYTGRNCTIPVYGGQPDGGDMTAWCAGDASCNSLVAGAWGCFAVHFPWKNASSQGGEEGDWNYFTVQLTRTSAEGDPDLFGLWSGGTRGVSLEKFQFWHQQ